MCQDRLVAGREQIEKYALDARRQDMMRRLDENVASAIQRQNLAPPDFADQVGRNMHIAPAHEAQADARPVNLELQGLDRGQDVAGLRVIDAGKEMRRAGHDRRTVHNSQTRHFE